MVAGLAGLTVVVVAASVAGVLALRGSGAPTAADPTPSLHTATVVRSDLAQSTTVPGSIGFGGATPVAGRGTGTVTWLPAVGDVVSRGAQLFRVDDQPVVLLLGSLPLYRPLSAAPGPDGRPLHGADVDLVAANLAVLGAWKGPTHDAAFTQAMDAAVRRWQASLGRAATGVIDPADVVVAARPVRVEAVTAHPGDTVAQPLLSVTGTGKVVTLEVPATLATGMTTGQKVQVTLADGTHITCTVATIGTADASGSTQNGTAAVPVTLVPPDGFDAPLGAVTGSVVTASRPDALHVPIAALLALAGGGYAVQLPDGTLTPVTIGMVADGDVEVSGVAAGTAVLVP